MQKQSWLDKIINNLPFEVHAIDPVMGKYSSLGPGTKHMARVQKYIKTGDKSVIAKNDLDLAAFWHDNAYSKYKTAPERKESDIKLIHDAVKIANDETKDGFERLWANIVVKVFEKKLASGAGLSRIEKNVLKRTYYDPKKGYSSIKQLADKSKISLKKTREWLLQQSTYTKHKPVINKFKHRRVYVKGIDHQWQADLVDMSRLKLKNNNYKYILTVIDLFSKYAWAIPIKNKTGDEITKAFTIIFKQRKPKVLQTDKGKEFVNKKVQDLFKTNAIKWTTTENILKAQTVERLNRTLKEKMYRYFTAKSTHHWLNVINNLTRNYNTSRHRTIKMTPIEASLKSNEGVVRKNSNMYPTVNNNFAFDLGDKVRISKYKNAFKKGYTPNYTDEIFIINGLFNTNPPMYSLTDLNGKPIIGTFYKEEFSLVP